MSLVGPCQNCPFRREGGIRLHPARAREIADGQVDGQGATFACHKTTVEDGDGDLKVGPESQYCGGALAFAAKLDRYNQWMRIAMRLGWWRPDQIDMAARAAVFGSVLEMVAAQTQTPIPRAKRPRRHTTPKRRK